MNKAENQINNLEHKEAKNNQSEQQQGKTTPQNEDSVGRLWGNFKHYNIHIIGVPEGEEKVQEIRNLIEKIMKEKFPNLVEEIDMQVQEAQRVPIMMDAKRPTPRHTIIKMPKLKTKRES